MAIYVSLYPSSRYGFVTPHTSPAYHSPTLTELLQQHPTTATASPASYEVMQNLRFPTPPITPPRTYTVALGPDESESTPQQPTQQQQQQLQQQPIEPDQQQQQQRRRTQSVIMKIGQGSNGLPAQHVATEISILNNAQMINDRRLITTTSAASHDDEATCSESSTASNEYICDWIDCGRFFDSLESLAGHVNQIHAVASPLDGLYYCRWSGCQRTERGFNARYKMLVHTRTHTKEKPHQCHLCDKSFSRAENLKIHIRSHSGERPYVCTFEGCSKKYSNSSDRFKHTRTHAMEKPYMCKVPGCQKKYTDPSSLRKHVKTFKHSAQLMENGHGAEMESSLERSPPNEEHHRSQSLYREMSSPTQQHYYIGMETDQLDDYYYGAGGAEPLKPAANYWISSSLEQSHCAPLPYGEKMQPMELEPLDLRTHRS